LRFLEVWFLGPLAFFVAGCFFFFGSFPASLPSSSAEGVWSASGDLRVLLWPVARFVAGCFFFFGSFSASLPSSSAEGVWSASGDLRVLLWPVARFVAGCFFFFGRGAAWQGRMVGGTCRQVAEVDCKLEM
jgi:hypothetical protein